MCGGGEGYILREFIGWFVYVICHMSYGGGGGGGGGGVVGGGVGGGGGVGEDFALFGVFFRFRQRWVYGRSWGGVVRSVAVLCS